MVDRQCRFADWKPYDSIWRKVDEGHLARRRGSGTGLAGLRYFLFQPKSTVLRHQGESG